MAEAKLQQVMRLAPAQRAAQAKTMVDQASVQEIVTMIGILTSEQTSIQDSKPIIEVIIKEKCPKLKNDECLMMCNSALEMLAPRKQFFAKEVSRCYSASTSSAINV